MAYLTGFAETYQTAAGTNVALKIPKHQAGDVLVCIVTQDASTAITGPAGWAQIGAQTSNGTSITGAAWWLRAASSAESATITTTDAWIARVFCIRDVDGTTPVDAFSWTTQTSTSAPSSASVTTTTADCFILYMVAVDGVAVQAHVKPGVMGLGSADNQGTSATAAATQANAWYIQRSPGATPAPSWTASASGVSVKLTVAFRNSPGGIIPAYIDDVSPPAESITPCHHFSTLNGISFPAALTTTASINGKTTSYVTALAAADLGINPYSAGLANASAIKPDTVLTGFEIAFAVARNLSTGLIMGSLIGGTPKMGAFGAGNVADGGYVIRIGSSSTNWCAYQVGAKDAVPNLAQRSVFAIQAGYTGSSYGTPGGPVATNAVTFVQGLYNTPYFSSQIILSELHQVFTQVVAGGTTSSPVRTDGVASVGRSFLLPVIQQVGATGLISYAPIQIGGGDAVNFQIDAGSLQFPRRYDAAKKEIAFHAADNSVGIRYAGKSGDVIKHTNSLISSPTSFYWEIGASATSAATWDFSGTSVINALVTLRPVTTFQNMSFTDCSSVTLNGSLVTNCKFYNSPIVAATPAEAAAVSNCTITSSGTGHGITISGAAASITLVGLEFYGYAPSNGSTGNEAIYVNIASGTVNITVSGGSTPSIRTAGATVNVISGATVTFTGLPIGCDIVILEAGTSTILHQVDSHNSTSYGWGYSGTPTVDVGFIKPGYKVRYIRGLALTSSDSTIPVELQTDLSYA